MFYLYIITISTFVHPFCFKAPKETLHRRIIPTITTTTHTLCQLVLREEYAVIFRRILHPLVRIHRHTFWVATSKYCSLQSIAY